MNENAPAEIVMGASKQKQMTYNTAGSIVTLFCQWMIMMVIPKMTNFSEAGVFAIALSICSILNIVATFWLHQQQVADQYTRYSENSYRATRLLTIAISFGLCLLVVLLFDYTLEQNLVIIAYMVYRNLLHYAHIHMATLQIRERLDLAGKCMILEGIVSFIAFVVSYHLTNDLVLSVAVMAVLGGGIFLGSVAYGYRRVVGRGYPWHGTDWTDVSSLMRIGAPLLLSIVAPVAITALPRLILQMTDGEELVGIFGTLAAPTLVIPTLVLGLFAPFIVYFSNLSRKGDMALLRKQYLKMAGLIIILGVFGYLLSWVAAGWVFERIYGDEIVPYVALFDIMVLGIAFYSVGMWGITVLITKEQGRAAAIASAAALVVSIIIFALMIPAHGINGATYGLMLSYGVFGLLISLCVLFLPLPGMRAGNE